MRSLHAVALSALLGCVLAQSTNTAADLATVLARRTPFIVQSIPNSTALGINVPLWLDTMQADGTWTDVDYTSGCPAQRANWPAFNHWTRIVALAAAYAGQLEDPSLAGFASNASTLAQTALAMDWWFSRDFTVRDCLDEGGVAGFACPCGTAGLWNTNWFSNVILVPRLVGQACLLLRGAITRPGCASMTARAFSTFFETPAQSFLTGANILDISSIGIAGGLLGGNDSLVADAFSRITTEVGVKPAVKVDGIKPDGGFQQHAGVLYNGNYGKDYSNDVIELASEAAGTQWDFGADSRQAFMTLLNGTSWMVYQNVVTGVAHYDFSVLGRFISFATVDLGETVAVSSILINTTQISQLGTLWGEPAVNRVAELLSTPTGNANIGGVVGTQAFWSNDFVVSRGTDYVTTLKMFSTRILTTECVNLANPLGFHLSDGTLYTHLDGTEYEDIAAAWDWNLIPGITTDYGGTPLACATAGAAGLEAFVGAAQGSNGKALAVMRYTNPETRALKWQKAWFFLPGGAQRVLINSITLTTSLDVYSVLDQRLLSGPVLVNGATVAPGDGSAVSNFTSAHTLLHGGVGYDFGDDGAAVSVRTGPRTGAWTALGTSTQPPETVDLFAAWLVHNPANLSAPVSYTAFPGTRSSSALAAKIAGTRGVAELSNDAGLSALWDARDGTLYAAFWAPGAVHVPGRVGVKVAASAPLVLVADLGASDPHAWTLSVADPSQQLVGANITLTLSAEITPAWGINPARTVVIAFPTGGDAGRTVVVPVL